MNPSIRLKKASALFLVVLGCYALSSIAQAELPPPPPAGGYPNDNTAAGDGALFNVTDGKSNTAIGQDALNKNTTGSENVAIGRLALHDNRDGSDNTANGFSALENNFTGFNNTANGAFALEYNDHGTNNTANGFHALGLSSGFNNTANGAFALGYSITGSNNTANGASALENDTTGNYNTANGASALDSNETGARNTADGAFALKSNTAGTDNIAIGYEAGVDLTTGDDNIDIGARGLAGESNSIRIGKPSARATFITGISGMPVAGSAVVVDSQGRLGVVPSSKRFKEAIEPMDNTSEAVFALKPVTFRYKKELDPKKIPQFGLIAEDVEKIDPDLVVRDAEGKVSSVRYEAVNAMLLNEFLKEHCKVQSLEKAMAEQQTEIAAMQTMLKEQEARIKKVSGQLESSKPMAQTVLNTQ
jgi:hypothetical protein